MPLNTPSPRAKHLALMLRRNESRFENGYDSDGQIGPFNFMEEVEGPQDYEEADHSERREVSESASKRNGDAEEETNETVLLTEDFPGRQHVPIADLGPRHEVKQRTPRRAT